MLKPQTIPKVKRITNEEISRQARIARQAQTRQEGLGFVVEYKVGNGTQKPMFEEDNGKAHYTD